jgi:ribonucleoside-diphosphate reductase alpha chain
MTKDKIFVKKRNGKTEPVNYEKIHTVLFWATEGLKNVSVSDIEMNAQLSLRDGITTREIHQVLIQSAVDLIHPSRSNYPLVAGRLMQYYIRKEVFNKCKDMPHLKDVIERNIKKGVYDPVILEQYDDEEIDTINDFIKHERDFDLTWAATHQMKTKYLLQNRTTKEIYETPQLMFVMIAMTLFATQEKKRLQYVRKFYNAVSTSKINLPTPIMCGVRTPKRQYSSCTLIDIDDDLESIFSSDHAIGRYTANRAGIGINVGRIRAIGSQIRDGEVSHTGVVPFLKKWESTTKCCTQNGVRGGGSTTHYPFWHMEVEDLIVLKNNRGSQDNRVRNMDYSIQFCRLFYKRVQENGKITLFSPHQVPDLYSAFGLDNDEFEELYEKYEKSRSVKKKSLKARDLFTEICKERIETGRIYIMNLDHCNSHSSFTDKVIMSNLCQEITLPTKPIHHIDDEDGEIALCVLSGINMGNTRLNELESVCDYVVRTLDYVISNQDYPVKAAEKMYKRRSIGVGVTNLAYFFAKNKVPYGSPESLELLDEYMEAMQYYLIKASINLAKELGPCEWMDRTKYGKGLLPIDHYNKNVDKIVKRSLSLDWEALRADLKQYGIRNSTLTAIMPAESSAVAQNATNGIEPIRDLMTFKGSKKGAPPMLAPDCQRIGHFYTFAYEMEGNKPYMDVCAVIQKYVDQAISANHYYNKSMTDEDGNLPMSVVMKDIFYHYQMGGKTLYYANTDDGKTDEAGCEGGGCTL